VAVWADQGTYGPDVDPPGSVPHRAVDGQLDGQPVVILCRLQSFRSVRGNRADSSIVILLRPRYWGIKWERCGALDLPSSQAL
jgi:hypothetical protein